MTDDTRPPDENDPVEQPGNRSSASQPEGGHSPDSQPEYEQPLGAQSGAPEGSGGADGGGSWLPGGLQWTPLTILLALLVVVGVAAAGVFVATGGEIPLVGGDAGSPALDTVPEGVDAVMYADSGIVDDATTKTMVNGLLSMSATNAMGTGPSSYSELMAQISNESNIAVDGFESATVFASYPEQSRATADYVGIVVESEWSEEEFIETIEANGEPVTEQSYRDTTVYVQPSEFGTNSWMAPLGNGRYIMGSEAAVTDVIDVVDGQMSAFSGNLRESYEGLRDGYVKFATSIPAQASEQAGQFSSQAQMARNVEAASGVYYTSGDDVGMKLHVTGTDQSAGKSIKQSIDAGLALATFGSQNNGLSELVEAVEVTQDGRAVTISFEYAAEELVSALEQLSERSGFSA